MIEKLLIGSIESDYSQSKVDIKFGKCSDNSSLSIFKAISSCAVLVDVINYSGFNSATPILFFTIKKNDVDSVMRSIKASGDSIEGIYVDVDIVIISVIGIGMRANSFVISEICRIFLNYRADIKSLSISEIRIEIMTTTNTAVDNIVRDLELAFL